MENDSLGFGHEGLDSFKGALFIVAGTAFRREHWTFFLFPKQVGG